MLNMKKLATLILSKFNDTGWKSVGSGVSYRVKNGFCTVVIEGATVGSSVATVLVTLPEEARPSVTINPYLHSNYVVGQCWIDTDGKLWARFQSNQSGTVAGFCTYPINWI